MSGKKRKYKNKSKREEEQKEEEQKEEDQKEEDQKEEDQKEEEQKEEEQKEEPKKEETKKEEPKKEETKKEEPKKEETKKEEPKKEETKKEIKDKNLDIHSKNVGLPSNVHNDINEGSNIDRPKIDLPNIKPPQTTQTNEEASNIISYNCTECSSLIEIISLLQDNTCIKFKCLNKDNSHEQSLSIKDYLIKMKNHHDKQLNDDNCKVHAHNNEKYLCYCFKCKKHLCVECLKSRTHLNHYKNSFVEIQPIQEELDIMKEIINDYKTKVEKLKNEKMIFDQNLNNSLNDKESKLQKIFEDQNQKDEISKSKELKINNEKFILEIEEIKRKYEEEIRIKKNEFEKNITKINNEYKEKNKKNEIILTSKKKELHEKFNEEIERLGYDKKIENLNSIVKFNEIVYNTYNAYKQNYYNCINLNNLLINYYKNENIKNNVMKKILKDDYDRVTELILERKNEYTYEIEKEAQKDKDKEKEKIRNLEIENQTLKEEIERLKKKLEEQREISQETEQNMVNENEQSQQVVPTLSTVSTDITDSSLIQK